MVTRKRALSALGVLLCRPTASWAQTGPTVRRIAWFGLGPLDAPSLYLEALRAELRDLGWNEGRNLAISRFTSTRAPEDFEVVGKRIEFLKDALPHVRRIAILARPQHPGEHRERAASEEAAQKLGITVGYFPIREVAEIDKAFLVMRQEHCDAVVIFPDYTMFVNRDRLARLAIEAKLPAISGWPSFAESGLLLNFGPNLRDIYRGLARYVHRILRGAKPEDLPVELPRTVELVVNMRTAKALGVKIPSSILLRADQVIE